MGPPKGNVFSQQFYPTKPPVQAPAFFEPETSLSIAADS